MTDEEFVDELVARLNHFIELNPDRANAVLCTELLKAGYASVGHFVGQLAMPRGLGPQTKAEDLQNVKFVLPLIEDGKIVKFEGVPGTELQERAQRFKPEPPQGPEDPKVH